MKSIYKVQGIVNRDFVGQIAYTVCLDKAYKSLDIRFTFDKQRFTEVTEEVKRAARVELEENKERYAFPDYTDEDLDAACLSMKTEIHTLAHLNDKFIGGIHRQMTDRTMHFDKDSATEGCLPQAELEGTLKVILLVFNVIYDDTRYTLEVTAEE